jgi:hypothetical protein
MERPSIRPGFPGMSSPTFDYHRPTDTLYIKLRFGESVDKEILADVTSSSI